MKSKMAEVLGLMLIGKILLLDFFPQSKAYDTNFGDFVNYINKLSKIQSSMTKL